MNLFVDLHIHSCLSPCGDMLMTPNNIAGMAYLKGLDVISVTDHNSARNLPAVYQAARAVGVCLLPGIEATSSEEVHILCYFKLLESATAFGEVIYGHLADMPNNPAFFGDQVVMNEQDEPIAVVDKLLIGALDLPINRLSALCRDYGGVCVPAHINRSANGILNALGFLPTDNDFAALEVNAKSDMPGGDFSAYRILRSSDAHRLEDMLEAEVRFEAAERSAEAVFDALSRGKV